MTAGNYTRRLTERFLQSVTPRRVIAMERILLYDFVTAHSDLLWRHREGLDRFVLPLLGPSAPPVGVWIGGLASRRGGESFNRRLARARATMVARYIFSRTPEAGLRHGVSANSFGEEMSRHHTENSELYRSVLVLVNRAQHVPPPPAAQPRHPRAGLFTKFRIRLRRIVEGGEGVAGVGAHFVIDYDPVESGAPPSDPVHYLLAGAGFGAGLLPLGGFHEDPGRMVWNPFTAPMVTNTRGFAGWAQLVSGGLNAGPFEAISGGMALFLSPSAGSYSLGIAPFQTSGAGIATGVSAIAGRLFLTS